ncbi:MAG TPA: xylulose 5-phosphate 3-epimerase, partial [Pseudomonas sp.]|nr:xylulose 5-phosphate 3-epimerase [Pseudomonas sp.]
FNQAQAEQLARDGAIIVDEQKGDNPILLIANGSYQLTEMQRATQRLKEARVSYRLVYLQEPGRFRAPRDRWEIEALAAEGVTERLFPEQMEMRVLLTHMRPEVARGHLWPILPDVRRNSVLGYRNRGGTLDEGGMQFANRASWANVLAACARLLDIPRTALLKPDEAAAVAGKGDPRVLR